MKVDVSEILSELKQKQKTGLLSISVVDDTHLFKIFVKQGDVCRISCGKMKGAECLAQFDGLELKSSFFLPDIDLGGERENIPPTNELISFFKITNKTVDLRKTEPESPRSDSEPVRNLPLILDEIKAALIEQVGPAGIKVFQRTVDEKWRPGPSTTSKDLENLVELLRLVIENDGDRQYFTSATKKILS
jgi:hypothetical protein